MRMLMNLKLYPVLLLLALLFVACGKNGKSTAIIAHPTGSVVLPAIPHPLFWENKPKSFSIRGNQITIEAGEKTDMFSDPNATYNTDNVPKLLFSADSSFVLSCAIEHGFVNKWDGGAIVLKSDSLDWIKFCFEKDYTGARRVVSVVTRNISDDCNSIAMDTNSVFFKMAKADNVITCYCSKDGIEWLLIRHFQFEAKPGFKVGFLAQSPAGTNCEVKFSNISYQATKIKDPYLGN
jgi:regulation of enolase protein 1 (concanavalin A-like superfamily)